MDVLSLINVFRLYPGLKMSFEHNSVRKNLFLSACFCWSSGLSLSEMDQNFQIWWTHCLWKFLFGFYISLLQSIQTTRNTTRCCWSCASKKWQRSRLLLHDWARTRFMFAWLHDWTIILPLR